MNPISNLSGDDLFRPKPRASVSPKYGVPFALRTGEAPPPTVEQLVTDTIPPLIVDAPVDHGPEVVEEVTRILAEVMLRDLPAPEPDPEQEARVEAWSAARMREIETPVEPVTLEDIGLDPELEPIGYAVWSELRGPVVPSPRQRPRAVRVEIEPEGAA